jgi:ribosomal protein L35
MRRNKMKTSSAKKLFRRTASGTHKKNMAPGPMRGGIRL